ncbi:hypothetical protein NEUTE1DRAFT_34303 [Neurospora tetrasperma FGSC 2508]|uniref:Uncharacterized protein n=1 Tax=Neurospora tetrasperma (strain FGSC 2508 / ATCC MYA-4615 / P0657) TaxID=510951 RepID=F8MCU1_NEUT8|nr:uncharacterized protein NEUTE1DRAFT_34303 [Neurospora tetrasperma FGSC 2508]EGO61339.1 hypothetical protein NEUTE1DRAFT_34303 [Neurospora tetrasperma FGSC 2508]EGZ74645.1 hypothetical protein NEUTE2DRAFT_58872 [Neurospora tetrasperma FGSC 2509]
MSTVVAAGLLTTQSEYTTCSSRSNIKTPTHDSCHSYSNLDSIPTPPHTPSSPDPGEAA